MLQTLGIQIIKQLDMKANEILEELQQSAAQYEKLQEEAVKRVVDVFGVNNQVFSCDVVVYKERCQPAGLPLNCKA